MYRKKEKNTPFKPQPHPENGFYFQKENYKWMLIGLGLIVLGFILMLGADANTVNGKYSADFWNDDIFSTRRIRVAPFLVVSGFALQVYAILKRKKK